MVNLMVRVTTAVPLRENHSFTFVPPENNATVEKTQSYEYWPGTDAFRRSVEATVPNR